MKAKKKISQRIADKVLAHTLCSGCLNPSDKAEACEFKTIGQVVPVLA